MPEPKRKTQEHINVYLNRVVPGFGSPGWLDGTAWRAVVRRQQLAMICRDTLITQVLQVHWEVRARDPKDTDKLKDDAKRYTEIFAAGDSDEGYPVTVGRLLQDALDIPFGGALELVRDDNSELVEIVNIDGATLRPTVDHDFPVMQVIEGYPGIKPIFLMADQVQRLYLTPRTDMRRRGWGMAPPERIYLALILLSRGDRYYANLLLDTPMAGILDLADMSETAAVQWASGFRELFLGPESFKIPVLYEHEKTVSYIPFGKSPADLAFNDTTTKYAGVTCSGYGLTLSDLGLGGARTLSERIREDSLSKRLGFGMLVTKLQYAFNTILPRELEWVPVRDDDETMVALGRSRITNARAMRELVDGGILSPQNALDQLRRDGLITIQVDHPPEQPVLPAPALQEHHLIGDPKAPSQGGRGEIKTQEVKS